MTEALILSFCAFAESQHFSSEINFQASAILKSIAIQVRP